MTGQHSPGYDAGYQKDRRAADKWLRQQHRQQWQDKFDQLRTERRKAEG